MCDGKWSSFTRYDFFETDNSGDIGFHHSFYSKPLSKQHNLLAETMKKSASCQNLKYDMYLSNNIHVWWLSNTVYNC